jgi:drug/metabolite transporter (DMT)-like permease
MLEPILNPLWVLLFYGEKPGVFALLGGVVILSSVAVWTIVDARAEAALLELQEKEAALSSNQSPEE